MNSSPRSTTDAPQRSGAWMFLLALAPLACWGLPLLLAAGAFAGTGALVGGVIGAVLLAAAAGLTIWVLRRRGRASSCATPTPASAVKDPTTGHGCC